MAAIRKRTWVNAGNQSRTAWTVDFTDANGRRERRQFSSRREADAFRVEIEGKLRTGTFRPEASRVTVKEAAALYLDYCEGRMRRSERMTRHNLAVYEGHVYNYIATDPARHEKRKRNPKLPIFSGGIGELKLAQLTVSKVSDFRDRLREAGVSVATTRKILATLRLVLEHAVLNDLVAVNVAKRIRVIGRRDEGSKKIVAPTKETIRRLIEVSDPDFRIVLIFASATGLRAGELHALRWRHLDLLGGEVSVETRVDAYGEEDVPKTAAGIRTVPLGVTVLAALKAWRLRSHRSNDNDLVFPNNRGRFQDHGGMVKRSFYPLFDRLAALHKEDPAKHPPAPCRFNWHALRHFAVSLWIEAGLSPKTIQTFAGHSSLQVTMDRYGHLFPSDDHKAAMDIISKELFK